MSHTHPVPRTIIVWFRRDLRVHDNPALWQAVQDADYVIPVFIFSDSLLHGTHASSNRNRFLYESLQDLQASLQERGAGLVLRRGQPADVLRSLAQETTATAVYYAQDYSPFARRRDARVEEVLQAGGVQTQACAGTAIVDDLTSIRTKAGAVHKVFTPFYRAWDQVARRPVVPAPALIPFPAGIDVGSLPLLSELVMPSELSLQVLPGGEAAGRARLTSFVSHGIGDYRRAANDMAGDATSRLSSYFHFGCLSRREAEASLDGSDDALAWRRQLAWADFYDYVIYHHPDNATREYQPTFRGTLAWGHDEARLTAWREGKTGYPIVDAAMRQLRAEGWIHNRARLIVGSFLTKDLWLDWRDGERYFMRMLLDGDEANNNGNWQWIASVGVDPAPVYRRLYNPTTQGRSYDPTGTYVRRFVPELRMVPDAYIHEPWKMSQLQQREAQCVVGVDYPRPIVDHAEARRYALAQYAQAKAQAQEAAEI